MERQDYLDRVLNFIIEDTIVGTIYAYGEDVVQIKVPFSYSKYYSIRDLDYGYEKFCEYCVSEYSLTLEECRNIWGEYLFNIDDVLVTEFNEKSYFY